MTDESARERAARCLPAFGREWEKLEPIAFLDDTRTKNVIVHCGRLSGILDAAARARVELYAAVFCVDFLSELGQRFNRDDAEAVDPARRERLLHILEAELARVDAAAGALA